MDSEHDHMPARVRAIVRGRVQGVYFRRFVAEYARRLNLAGSVRNGEDGTSVEIVAEGARTDLERLLDLARHGPPHARVDGLEASWSEPLGEAPGFRMLG